MGIGVVGFYRQRAVAASQGVVEFFEFEQRDAAIVQRLRVVRGNLQRRVVGCQRLGGPRKGNERVAAPVERRKVPRPQRQNLVVVGHAS